MIHDHLYLRSLWLGKRFGLPVLNNPKLVKGLFIKSLLLGMIENGPLCCWLGAIFDRRADVERLQEGNFEATGGKGWPFGIG